MFFKDKSKNTVTPDNAKRFGVTENDYNQFEPNRNSDTKTRQTMQSICYCVNTFFGNIEQ